MKSKNVKSALVQAGSILLDPIVAIVFALVAGAIIIGALGNNVLQAYTALWQGAFGSVRSFSQTLLAATPLMFTAMAFAMANRCGMFNLGGEGQFYIGAIMGAWVGFALKGLPAFIHIPLVILAGALGGLLVGMIPAILKAKRGVNEVIVCIMMNYIGINITNYLVNTNGPLRQGSTLPATPMVQPAAKMAEMIPGTRLTGGFIVAGLCAILFYVFVWKTRAGYKIRAVGYNPLAAECGGVKTLRYAVLAMMLAGAFAGIGGAVEISGVHGRFYGNFSPGYGFEGVAVSMLGGNHPFGILLSALLFGALKTGAMAMQIQAGTNAELVKVLQALVIFFIAGKWSVMAFLQHRMKNRTTKGKMQPVQGGEC